MLLRCREVNEEVDKLELVL